MSDYLKPAIAILLPNIGGITAGLVTRNSVNTWYEEIKKPSWRPPNKVFPVAWTALYTCMGTASYLVWRDGGGFGGDAALPLAWYGGQLALNFTWSPIFFGLRNPKLAMVNITCLWGAIVGTTYMFYDISPTAAYLMLPYLGWVTFASALNYRIWRDNPDQPKKD